MEVVTASFKSKIPKLLPHVFKSGGKLAIAPPNNTKQDLVSPKEKSTRKRVLKLIRKAMPCVSQKPQFDNLVINKVENGTGAVLEPYEVIPDYAIPVMEEFFDEAASVERAVIESVLCDGGYIAPDLIYGPELLPTIGLVLEYIAREPELERLAVKSIQSGSPVTQHATERAPIQEESPIMLDLEVFPAVGLILEGLNQEHEAENLDFNHTQPTLRIPYLEYESRRDALVRDIPFHMFDPDMLPAIAFFLEHVGQEVELEKSLISVVESSRNILSICPMPDNAELPPQSSDSFFDIAGVLSEFANDDNVGIDPAVIETVDELKTSEDIFSDVIENSIAHEVDNEDVRLQDHQSSANHLQDEVDDETTLILNDVISCQGGTIEKIRVVELLLPLADTSTQVLFEGLDSDASYRVLVEDCSDEVLLESMSMRTTHNREECVSSPIGFVDRTLIDEYLELYDMPSQDVAYYSSETWNNNNSGIPQVTLAAESDFEIDTLLNGLIAREYAKCLEAGNSGSFPSKGESTNECLADTSFMDLMGEEHNIISGFKPERYQETDQVLLVSSTQGEAIGRHSKSKDGKISEIVKAGIGDFLFLPPHMPIYSVNDVSEVPTTAIPLAYYDPSHFLPLDNHGTIKRVNTHEKSPRSRGKGSSGGFHSRIPVPSKRLHFFLGARSSSSLTSFPPITPPRKSAVKIVQDNIPHNVVASRRRYNPDCRLC